MPFGLAWPTRTTGWGEVPAPGALLKGVNEMMKVAVVTAAVLALGLAACSRDDSTNNAANETAVENNADADVNAASNDAAAVADNALNAAENAIENAGNAVENAANSVENAAR